MEETPEEESLEATLENRYRGWLISYTKSMTDPSHQMIWSHHQWRSLTSNSSPRGLIYRPQTKAWTVRSRCQTRRWCSSKPDPPDLLQSSRRCPEITRLEACSRPTSHHMDPSDLPGHGNIGDWCSRAGWGQIVLAANRNGVMLRLIASRHDDDDDDDVTCWCRLFQVWAVETGKIY